MRADALILDIDWLITVDDRRRVIRDAGIAVVDGKFRAIGKSAEIARDWTSATTVDGRGRRGPD
jgi:cytosine/adenosine deaminase-related metal-dependent hydrolase